MFELLYTAVSVLHWFKVEGIHSTWKERKKTGGEYSSRHAAGHRHVVVCTSNLSAEYTMDFLIEFYANRKLEVLLARYMNFVSHLRYTYVYNLSALQAILKRKLLSILEWKIL